MSTTKIETSVLANPSDLSCFPAPEVKNEVLRDSLLTTTEQLIDSDERLIILTGGEGMGKTTIISQFVKRNSKNTIAVFINAVNKISYCEENILLDIYRQISFYLNGIDEQIDTFEAKDFNRRLYLLESSLKRDGKKLYFAIDGLSDIPPEDHYIVKNIIDTLPLHLKHIFFIFSSQEKVVEKFLKKPRIKHIEAISFSEYEATKILPNIELSLCRDILKVFRGRPEKLSTIRRLIDNGMKPEEILEQFSTNTESLIKAEWENSEKIINENKLLFGLITFCIQSLELSQLCSILKKDPSEVRTIIQSISFLSISGKEQEITYISPSIKSYAKRSLKDIEIESLNKILTFLNLDPENSLPEVSLYFERMKKFPEILTHLSTENLGLLFKKSNRVNDAIRQVKIGIRAANEIRDENQLLRLSHIQSILSGISTSKILTSEILCHLSESNYESALALASSGSTLEERFHLLAVVAKYQKKKTDKIDEEIEKRITEEFENINPEHLGFERTLELATELFSAFPELSLSLINKIDSLEKGGGNKTDYAFFMLSLEALKQSDEAVDLLLNQMPSVEDKKKDALSMLGLFKKGTPSDRIIEKVESFSDKGDAIFILRNWISTFPEENGTSQLIEKLLSMIVTTTDYHANASLYADISVALKYLEKEKGLSILRKIQSRLDNLKKIGPTLDYIKIQIELNIFESKHKIKSNRANETIKYITNNIEDESVRLSALTYLTTQTKNIDLESININLDQLKFNSFNRIIDNTADHVSIIKNALIQESKESIRTAISWAEKLNTRPRRDQALSIAIKQACRSQHDLSVDEMCQTIRKIKNKDQKNETTISFMRSCEKLDSISKSEFKKLQKLRNRIKNSFVLCKINTILIKLLGKIQGSTTSARDNIVLSLDENWKKIDGLWHRVDVAFDIHNELLNYDRELAKYYKEKAINLREKTIVNDGDAVESHILSIDLAIRCVYFLCKNGNDIKNETTVLVDLINNLPSEILKIKQLSRLASVFYLTERTIDFNNLVGNKLLPAIDDMGTIYNKEISVALYWACPIFFKYGREIFERKLQIISEDVNLNDIILDNTHRFILNKTIINDPFDPIKNQKYKIAANELDEHMFLIKNMKEDLAIYSALSRITNAVHRRKKENIYSREQLAFLSEQIEHIISENLGHADYIRHDGYKICCKSILLKLNSEKSLEKWNKLIEEHKAIPILSDQVIVLGEIIENMPGNLRERKKDLLREAVTITSKIPSKLEQISRYEYLSKIGQEFDLPYVKSFLREAVIISAAEDSEVYREKRLNLIDSIFSMDEDFAAGLSAVFDDDPARKRVIEENISRAQEEKKEREEIELGKGQVDDISTIIKQPSLFWKKLGQLNASNYVPPKHIDYTSIINNTANLDLELSYPILSFFIHSIGKPIQDKRATNHKILPMLNCFLGNSIFQSEIFQFKESTKEIKKSSSSDGQVILGESNAEEAINFIKSWVHSIQSFDENTNIIIIDPYFTLEDLEMIGESINKDPNFVITILTSFKRLDNIDPDGEICNAVKTFWRNNVSSNSMPFFDLVFCGAPSTLPIHDRWWLSGKSGLRFGGSLNGLDAKRISTISKMKNDEVLQVTSKTEGYVNQTQRMFEGERLNYQKYTI